MKFVSMYTISFIKSPLGVMTASEDSMDIATDGVASAKRLCIREVVVAEDSQVAGGAPASSAVVAAVVAGQPGTCALVVVLEDSPEVARLPPPEEAPLPPPLPLPPEQAPSPLPLPQRALREQSSVATTEIDSPEEAPSTVAEELDLELEETLVEGVVVVVDEDSQVAGGDPASSAVVATASVGQPGTCDLVVGSMRASARKSAPPTRDSRPLPPRAAASARTPLPLGAPWWLALPLPPPRPPLALLEVDASDMRPLLQEGEREGGWREWSRRPAAWTGLVGLTRDVCGLRRPAPPVYSIEAALEHVRDLVSCFGGNSWLYIGITSQPPEDRWRSPGRHGRAHCDIYLRMLVAIQGPGRAMRELERQAIAYYGQVAEQRLQNRGPGGEGISPQNPSVMLYVCVGRR